MKKSNEPIFRVVDYSVVLKDSDGKPLPIIENISFCLNKGKCLGIAGESGSGKSVLVMSSLGLVPKASIEKREGQVFFKNEEVFESNKLKGIMGKNIGFIFQEPMTAMNPLMTLYEQISETVKTHMPELKRSEVKERVINSLKQSGFDEPEKFLSSYPHQLSGGMRQRAMIAMAIVLEPELIVADEPTTAIDAELQIQVLTELRKRINSGNCGIIFISHDLGVMRAVSDEIAILYCGCLVEKGPTEQVLTNPMHPYTKALINALPRLIEERKIPESISGTLPSPDNKPKGCVFSTRCKMVKDDCLKSRPSLRQVGEDRFSACLFDL